MIHGRQYITFSSYFTLKLVRRYIDQRSAETKYMHQVLSLPNRAQATDDKIKFMEYLDSCQRKYHHVLIQITGSPRRRSIEILLQPSFTSRVWTVFSHGLEVTTWANHRHGSPTGRQHRNAIMCNGFENGAPMDLACWSMGSPIMGSLLSVKALKVDTIATLTREPL
jgi:hypothetical protein